MKVKTYYSLDNNSRLNVIDHVGYDYEGNSVVQFGFIQTLTKGDNRESKQTSKTSDTSESIRQKKPADKSIV